MILVGHGGNPRKWELIILGNQNNAILPKAFGLLEQQGSKPSKEEAQTSLDELISLIQLPNNQPRRRD
jgi:hypothetical protein